MFVGFSLNMDLVMFFAIYRLDVFCYGIYVDLKIF